MKSKKHVFQAVLIAIAVFCSVDIAAQGMPALFGKGRANNKDRSSDIPSTITAMSMDVDMGKNIATLLGDVFVDDQDMTIRCEKMLIFFEDEKKKEGEGDDEGSSSKRPIRIECYTDVVIQGKQKPSEDGKPVKEQKATADKAVYDLVKDEITLTGKPVIYDGGSKVSGSKIIIIVNEERMIVLRGTASTTEALDKKKK